MPLLLFCNYVQTTSLYMSTVFVYIVHEVDLVNERERFQTATFSEGELFKM